MLEPKTAIFFNRCSFPVSPERLFAALEEDAGWQSALGGTPRDREARVKIRLDHAASGGIIEALVAVRGEGSRLTVSLYAESLERAGLEALSERSCAWFDALEAKLGTRPDNLLPVAWPVVHGASGVAPRVVRRADYAWHTAGYTDAPEDTMGAYAELTHPLGVTQFGADVHRLLPGERNCRNHAELHEQEGFLVLSGSCKLEVEGQVVELAPGDFCVTFPGEAHFFFNASDAPCEVLTFGGPNLFASGAYYPHGRDDGWRERLL